jgi:chitodextrinase
MVLFKGTNLFKMKWITVLLFFALMGMVLSPYMYVTANAATGLTIHFKKPAGWSEPKLYYYDTQPGTVPTVDWTTAPAMNPEGSSDWYVYTIEGATSAYVIFKDDSNQIPDGPGFFRDSESWFDGVNWFTSDPKDDAEKPTAPTNLEATQIKGKSTILSWTEATDNIAIAGYHILRDGVKIAETTETSYFVMGLTPQITYNFSVVAKDAADNLSDPMPNLEVTTTASTGAEGLTVHFKKPADWSTPQLYFYGQQPTGVPGVDWGTAPEMTAEENGWYVYTIEYATSAYVIFKDGTNQIPPSGQPGFIRSTEGWYDGTEWSDSNPDIDSQKPTAPTDLASSEITETSVKLTWTASTDNVGVTGYEVWQNGTKIADELTTSYTVQGLTAATLYTFSVRAVDAVSNYSEATTGLEVTTASPPPVDAEAPTAPTDLASSEVTETSVKLTWTESTDNVGVTGYEVWQNDTKIATVNELTYTVINLTADTAYSFVVRAFDEAENYSDLSNTVELTTSAPDAQPPTAPTLTVDDITDKSVVLKWTASTDNVGVTGYEVWQNGTKIAIVDTLSYKVTGLEPETKYVFVVRAFDAVENYSDSSTSVEATTLELQPNLVTIYYKRGFATPFAHYSYQTGQWTSVPGMPILASEFVGYNKITVNIGAAANLTVAFNDGLNSWDSNNGANYTFDPGIWTFTPDLAGAAGTIDSGKPDASLLDIETPTKPTNVTANDLTKTSLTLTWTASTDNHSVVSYEVWKDGLKLTDVVTNSAEITGLTTGTTYKFKVRALDPAGNFSDTSSEIEVTTESIDTQSPTSPSTLTATKINVTDVTLAWTASTDNVGVTGYEVWKDGSKIADVLDASYVVTGLTGGTSYTFAVLAYDATGNKSTASTTLSLKTGPIPQNKVTIYYRKGFAKAYAYYSFKDGEWTASPGTLMTAAGAPYYGYLKLTVNIGPATSLKVVFNDGLGVSDNNNNSNYQFGIGTWTYKPSATNVAGTIKSGVPAGADLIKAPKAPTGISFSNANGIVKVSWKAEANAKGYKIYWNNAHIATLGDVLSYTFDTSRWVKGQSYNVQVASTNEAGMGNKSGVIKVSVKKDVITVIGTKVYINNKPLASNVQAQLINGRIFLPVKAIFEPFGVKIGWTAKTKTITATKRGFNLSLTVNSKSGKLNGNAVGLEVSPTIINGSTYVPLRFVGDSLGVIVEYKAK